MSDLTARSGPPRTEDRPLTQDATRRPNPDVATDDPERVPVRARVDDVTGSMPDRARARGRWRLVAHTDWAAGVASIVAGVALWEAVVRVFDIPSRVIAAPTGVVGALGEAIADGSLWPHLSSSRQGYVLGLLLAMLVGIPFGLVLGTSRMARRVLDPWVNAFYAVPMLALAPLIVVIFGFSISTKVAVVFTTCFFPIVINTQAGVRSTDTQILEVVGAFGATTGELFRHVYVPWSVPFVVAGVRLAVGRGLIGVVAADLFGARAGLGLLLLQSAQLLRTDVILMVGVILAALGVSLTAAVHALEERVSQWR